MMDFKAYEHTCIDEGGTRYTFQYHLLRDVVQQDGTSFPDYGIAVHSSQGETVRIPHISPDRQRVLELLTLLCEQGVSPIHLQNVIEDWL